MDHHVHVCFSDHTKALLTFHVHFCLLFFYVPFLCNLAKGFCDSLDERHWCELD